MTEQSPITQQTTTIQQNAPITNATQTQAPVAPTQTQTQAPVAPTQTQTQAPVAPTQTQTQAPVAPTQTQTQAPVAPTQHTDVRQDTPLTPPITTDYARAASISHSAPNPQQEPMNTNTQNPQASSLNELLGQQKAYIDQLQQQNQQLNAQIVNMVQNGAQFTQADAQPTQQAPINQFNPQSLVNSDYTLENLAKEIGKPNNA